MSETAIEVRGLRKSFGEKEAVAGVDLEIAAGSLAGLVGPNGAGKTTSLLMMTGLLRPDAGQVVINGLDVWADPVAAKAVIGVVPAEARLFERLSGSEMLEYAGRLRGLPAAEARSRAGQLLDVLDLAALVTADASTGSSQLRGTALPLARYGLRGAVAARLWIYQRREPTSLVYWAMTAVIMGFVSASTILGAHQHGLTAKPSADHE